MDKFYPSQWNHTSNAMHLEILIITCSEIICSTPQCIIRHSHALKSDMTWNWSPIDIRCNGISSLSQSDKTQDFIPILWNHASIATENRHANEIRNQTITCTEIWYYMHLKTDMPYEIKSVILCNEIRHHIQETEIRHDPMQQNHPVHGLKTDIPMHWI